MTLAVLNGPLNFPVIDTMKSHTSYVDDQFVLRRLGNANFVLIEMLSGNYALRVGEVSSGGSVTLGSLVTGSSAGAVLGYCTLSDGRFLVLTGSTGLVVRLHGADGVQISTLTVISNMNSAVVFGGNVFYWIGDYFDIVEAEAGKVLVFASTQNIDTDEQFTTAFQVGLSGSTLTNVGSPTKIGGYTRSPVEGSEPSLNIIGSQVIAPGIVAGATWGNRNGINEVFTATTSVGGPVLIERLQLDTNCRLREPIVRRSSTGLVLFGQNDIWGSGHTGSGTDDDDAVILVPVTSAGDIGSPTRVQFSESESFYFVRELFDFGSWPEYQQQVDRFTRALMSDGVDPEFVRYDEFDLTSVSSGAFWEPLERLDIPTPTVAPWDPSFAWEWCHYEGLSAEQALILAGGYNYTLGAQQTALWVVTRGEESDLGAHVGGTRVRWS